MSKFPADAPIDKVIGALESLGFSLVRKGNHIAMIRDNPDGTRTPLTIPNHRKISSRINRMRNRKINKRKSSSKPLPKISWTKSKRIKTSGRRMRVHAILPLPRIGK